jgi:MFS family permease
MTTPDAAGARATVSPWALPILLLIVFISLIGFGVVVPLLPFYAEAFNAPAWQITLMFATFSLGQFLGEPFWGRMSDRLGRRPVLLFTITISALGYVALAYAPDIWTAIATRLLAGFFAGNISTIQGYVADITPPEKRAGRLGLIGAAFGMGFVVGPSLGGLMAHPELGAAGFRPPLMIAAGLCVIAAIGLFLFVGESQSAHHRAQPRRGQFAALGDAMAHPVLRRLLATTLTAFVAFSAMQATFGLWGQARFGWGPKEVGLIFAASGVLVALSQGLLAGAAARRFGEVATLTSGLALTSVSLFVQAFSPWEWPAVAAMMLTGLGFSICQPSTTSLISRAAKSEHQGAMLGVNAAAGALARITGPIAGGFLFGIGAYAPFLFGAVGMIPAVWLAIRAGEALKQHRARV